MLSRHVGLDFWPWERAHTRTEMERESTAQHPWKDTLRFHQLSLKLIRKIAYKYCTPRKYVLLSGLKWRMDFGRFNLKKSVNSGGCSKKDSSSPTKYKLNKISPLWSIHFSTIPSYALFALLTCKWSTITALISSMGSTSCQITGT